MVTCTDKRAVLAIFDLNVKSLTTGAAGKRWHPHMPVGASAGMTAGDLVPG